MPRYALIRLFGLFFAVSFSVTSCGDNTSRKWSTSTGDAPAMLTEAEALAVYQHYLQGDYDGFVACMQSCDDKPAAYRQQMVSLYKQHAADQKEDDGDVTNAQIVRIQSQLGGRAAEVFVNLTYETGKTEEILLQFVHDGKAWRLR